MENLLIMETGLEPSFSKPLSFTQANNFRRINFDPSFGNEIDDKNGSRIGNEFGWSNEDCIELLKYWNLEDDFICGCQVFHDWYEYVFAWQPLHWYLSILKFAAEYDDQCLTFFEMECQDRRYAFNWVQEQIYNLECDGNCSSSKRRSSREIMDGCDDL